MDTFCHFAGFDWKVLKNKKLQEAAWTWLRHFSNKKINNTDDFLTKINVSSLISSLQLSLRTTHQSGQCTVDTKDPSATAPCWTQKLIVSNPQWSVSTHTHSHRLSCSLSMSTLISSHLNLDFKLWIWMYFNWIHRKRQFNSMGYFNKNYNGCWLTFSDWIHEDVF